MDTWEEQEAFEDELKERPLTTFAELTAAFDRIEALTTSDSEMAHILVDRCLLAFIRAHVDPAAYDEILENYEYFARHFS